MSLSILHTNDMHGTLSAQNLTKLKRLRDSADVYFDTGDAIKTGNLGIPFRQEPVWALLEELECTASVLGNRETHILESAFLAKIAGAHHPILVANLRKKDGNRPLPPFLVIERNGFKIGVFGVMVPMVTERMKTKAASAYLWDSPIETALQTAEELRPQVDLVIALTHIGHREDLKLVGRGPAIDILLGGHSHTIIEHPEHVGKTWICQGGSHSKFAGAYLWDGNTLTGSLQSLTSI